MSMRLGLGLGLPTSGRAGSAVAAYQQILNLATDDGWAAVYDPTNPDTRTLREDGGEFYAEANADGLGNAAAMSQATAANQFRYLEGGLGQLDAWEGGTTRWLLQATAMSLSQPIHIIIVAKATTASVHRYAYDGDAVRFATTFNSSNTYVSAAGSAVTGGTTDLDAHVVSARYDGDFSYIRVDGTEIATGNAGSNGVDKILWGVRNDKALPFRGLLGPLLVYDGAPPDAVRDRMEDLLYALMA